MNVRIMHNSTNITGHTIRYDREHKLCTGIGMIELEVDYSYSGTFDPWDAITIYENGSQAAKYYVSSASENQPSASITVTAQDNSKRLSDYFIIDSYLIDYPSYTRYWIELFLNETGVDYTFLTDEPGSIMSNNTSLGLMSAYEQIISLLQMSGWYITFNSTGRAIIGKLDIDSAKNKGTIGTHDTLEIKVDKNDRMYRNRVVVWGAGDPSTSRWVFSDVRKPTKWDYDSRDLRTILISNSNIPTVAAAFMLANQALSAFAKLNIEKYLTVTGARGFSAGDVINIKTKIYTGKGLITTFGVSMSKAGLVSNIACDERCPRLFGYFNPGGWVYVGTFGDGVWRKHLLDYSNYSGGAPSGVVLSGLATTYYSGGWFNYSSGLMDLNVTDLHVNNAVLACVTSSGEIYYSLEDQTPWSGIVLSGFDVTYSGAMVDSTVYSGLMGRACIIDRDTNFLRYAVDTRSGINYGDFLYETDPMRQGGLFWYVNASGQLVNSGIMLSGFPSNHSWVVDADPYDGTITETYPVFITSGIMLSGVPSGQQDANYNFTVYDIENDGTHDYVEAMTYGSGLIPSYLQNGLWEYPFDSRLPTTMAYSGWSPIKQTFLDVADGGGFFAYTALYDYTPSNPAYVVYGNEDTYGNKHIYANRIVISPTTGIPGGTIYDEIVLTNATNSNCIGVVKIATDIFAYDFEEQTTHEVTRYTYYLATNSYSTESLGVFPNVTGTANYAPSLYSFAALTRNGYRYTARGLYTHSDNGFTVEVHKTSLLDGSDEVTTLISKSPSGSIFKYFSPTLSIFPYGNYDVIVTCAYLSATWIVPNDTYNAKLERVFCTGFGGNVSGQTLYDIPEVGTKDSFGNYSIKQTNNSRIHEGSFNDHQTYQFYDWTSNDVTDFLSSVSVTAPSTSVLYNYRTIYEVQRDVDYGVALDNDKTTLYIINTNDGTISLTVPQPAGYKIFSFSGVDTYNGELFVRVTTGSITSPSFANSELVSINLGGIITRRSEIKFTGPNFPEIILGNFRLQLNGSGYDIYYLKPNPTFGYFPMYMVLQRDGWDFNIVKSGVYQDRLDISNYSPLVTMARTIASTETFFMSMDSTVTETSHLAVSGYNMGIGMESGSLFQLGVTSDDFRYSDFDGLAGSGLGAAESGFSRTLMIAYSGNVGAMDIYTLDSFSGQFLSPSGYVNRIELSNYCLPDQYVFLSVSGYTNSGNPNGWGFFQKSPSYSGYDVSSGVFVDYSSGYPQSRTTIIRLDDSI
jgi:hypothetical protein